MYVKVLSTRHTAIGTLRRGVIYDLDAKNHRVKKVITALSKGKTPALKEISAAAAKKAAKEVQSLVPKDAPDDRADKVQLAEAKQAVEVAEADVAKSGAVVEAAAKENADLKAQLAEAKKAVEAAEADMAKAGAVVEAAAKEIEDLKTQLAEAKKADPAKAAGK